LAFLFADTVPVVVGVANAASVMNVDPRRSVDKIFTPQKKTIRLASRTKFNLVHLEDQVNDTHLNKAMAKRATDLKSQGRAKSSLRT